MSLLLCLLGAQPPFLGFILLVFPFRKFLIHLNECHLIHQNLTDQYQSHFRHHHSPDVDSPINGMAIL